MSKSTKIPYFLKKKLYFFLCYFCLQWVGKVVWEPTKAKFFQRKLPRKAFFKKCPSGQRSPCLGGATFVCVCALKKWVNVIPKEKRQKELLLFLPNALTTSGWAVKWTAMRLLADFTWKLYLKKKIEFIRGDQISNFFSRNQMKYDS